MDFMIHQWSMMYSLKNPVLKNTSLMSACFVVIYIINQSIELKEKCFSSYFL